MIKSKTSLNQFLAEHQDAAAKRKVGRKAKPGADRYEDGRLKPASSKERADNAKETAIAARQRVFGISAKDADSQEGGTAVGRLWLEDKFGDRKTQGKDALEAAEQFRSRRQAYERAIDARSIKTSTNYADGAGGDPCPNGDEKRYVDQCNIARRLYGEIRRVILGCEDPMAMMAIEMVVIDDIMPKDQATMGALRIGLNAINRLLRFEKKRG
jgi:hypothetical protein